jgi:preprotein translocase subunit SecG
MKTWLVVLAAALAAGVTGLVLLGRGASRATTSLGGASGSLPAQAGAGVAEANLQSAATVLQAYHVVNGTYAGAVVTDPTVTVANADATGYCIESTVDGQTASRRGPGGTAVPGVC